MNKKIFAYVSVTLLLLACQPTLTNTHPSLQSSSNMHPEQKNTPHLFNALSSQNTPQPSESAAFTDPDREKLIPNLAKSRAVLPKRNLDLSSQKIKKFNYPSKFGPSPTENKMPFDPEREKLIPNLAKSKNITLPKRRLDLSSRSPDLHWGVRSSKISTPTNNQFGVYAGHSVQPTLNLPATTGDDTVLYSPTSMPPNNATIEAVTIYFRPQGQSQTYPVFGVFDHVDGGWEVYEDMTITWQNKYTAHYTDGQFYFVQVYKDSSTTYKVELYNFQTSSWENIPPIDHYNNGVTIHDDGWTIHEPKWPFNYCHSLPSIKASNVQIFNGSNWYLNTSGNGGYEHNASGPKCPNWTYNLINNFYEWKLN